MFLFSLYHLHDMIEPQGGAWYDSNDYPEYSLAGGVVLRRAAYRQQFPRGTRGLLLRRLQRLLRPLRHGEQGKVKPGSLK